MAFLDHKKSDLSYPSLFENNYVLFVETATPTAAKRFAFNTRSEKPREC